MSDVTSNDWLEEGEQLLMQREIYDPPEDQKFYNYIMDRWLNANAPRLLAIARAAEKYYPAAEKFLGQMDWGRSAFDGETLGAYNDASIALRRALRGE